MPAVSLAPIFNAYQGFSNGGVPLAGGLLYSYAAGTTTPQTTYTTSAGTVPNANPMVLNAAGRPPQDIWLVTGSAYKFEIQDSLGNPLDTIDNIQGIENAGAAEAAISASVTTASLTATGPTVLGDAAADPVTINGTAISNPNGSTFSNAVSFSNGIAVTGLTATTTITASGLATAGGFAPTSSSVPTNGMYLSAANTLGWSVNGVLKLFLDSNGRLLGRSLHNNASLPTGTTDQPPGMSGTYTPTVTVTAGGMTSPTGFGAKWMRVGNVVSVVGSFVCSGWVSGTLSTVRISLPIASNLATAEDLSGVGSLGSATSFPNASCQGNSVADEATFTVTPNSNGAFQAFFQFMYEVK